MMELEDLTLNKKTLRAREQKVMLGAMAPSLQKQGVTNDPNGHWQKDADAIARLYVRGYITEPVKERSCRLLAEKLIFS